MPGGATITYNPRKAGFSWTETESEGDCAAREFHHAKRLRLDEIQRVKALIKNKRARDLRRLTNRGPIVGPDIFDPETDIFLLYIGLIRYCHDGNPDLGDSNMVEVTPFGRYDNALLVDGGGSDPRYWQVHEVWHMDKKQYRRSGRHNRSGAAHHVSVGQGYQL